MRVVNVFDDVASTIQQSLERGGAARQLGARRAPERAPDHRLRQASLQEPVRAVSHGGVI